MAGLASVIKRFTKQTMVYWNKIGSDGFGMPVYADPVEVAVRWEDKEKEILTADGRKVLSHAYILLGSPVAVGSKVLLGKLTDWQAMPTYPAIPTQTQGANEIMLLKTTPDLKALSSVYEAYV